MTSDEAVLEAVAPILQVHDVPASIEWYQTVLGFKVEWSIGEPPVRAGLSRDRVDLNIVHFDGRPVTISELYFETRSVQSFYDRVAKAGGHITIPLADRHYGMKDFRVVDPSNNQLSFGEPLE